MPTSPPPNLLLGRAAVVEAGAGDPGALTDGRTAPEGSPVSEAPVRLLSVSSTATVDLGDLHPVRALLLQASSSDVYFVEASPEGQRWTIVWRVAPLLPTSELRTRTVVLGRPIEARFLRVRPTTTRAPALSELAAFTSEPTAWPLLDRSRRNASLPPWPGLTAERLVTLFSALSALLLAASVWCAVARRAPESPGERRARRGALLAVAAVSLLAWPNAGNLHYHARLHHWEFAHYYLGSKYLAELGYTNLYACAALADVEDGIDLGEQPIRDLRDNRVVPSSAELARAPECRASFSPARWEQFGRDARFFRELMGAGDWSRLRLDHGFNGTPTWALMGGALAGMGPASSRQLAGLAVLDVLLLLGLFLAIGVGFGLEGACLAAGFFGVNALAPFGWTGGAFLRYDWLLWLVGGLIALRRRRAALAGFALTLATLLRVFPGLALAGIALKALAEVLADRSLRPLRARLPLAAGAVLALALGGLTPLAVSGRPGLWSDFARNSAKHHGVESSNKLGLATLLAHDSSATLELMQDPLRLDRDAPWEARRAALRQATAPARWAAAAAFVLILTLAVRSVPDWAAAALGLGLMPILFSLSSYYYSAFVVFGSLWALSSVPGVALALLAWGTNVISAWFPAADERYAMLSLATIAFAVAVTAAVGWSRGRDRGGAQATKPEPLRSSSETGDAHIRPPG